MGAIINANQDPLKIESLMCFPLYASAKAMMANYKQFLDKYNLTFTQYLTMIVLWENESLRVKDLGNILHLDSGTLTPLLKKLTAKGYINREHGRRDEREVFLTLTDSGAQLKDELSGIPKQVAISLNLTEDEFKTLFSLLYKILHNLEFSMQKSE
jgi:DNA-binding MarR family transcriptional regulator